MCLIGYYSHEELIEKFEKLRINDLKRLYKQIEQIEKEKDFYSYEFRLSVYNYIQEQTIGLEYGNRNFLEVPISNMDNKQPSYLIDILYYMLSSEMIDFSEYNKSQIDKVCVIIDNFKNHLDIDKIKTYLIAMYLMHIDTFTFNLNAYAVEFKILMKMEKMQKKTEAIVREMHKKMDINNENFDKKLSIFGKKIKNFNANIITIITIIFSAFSIIGFNLFIIQSSLSLNSIIILNLSMVFSLSIVFSILDYLIFEKGKVYYLSIISGTILFIIIIILKCDLIRLIKNFF